MEFGDFASIAFVLIILLTFLWPFGRGKLRPGGTPVTGGPKDFAESGGYTPATVRPGGVVPVPSFQSRQPVYEEGDPVPRSRGEERLTREELAERGPSAGSRPTAEERRTRRPARATPERKGAESLGDQILTQLSQPESAQLAFVVKEVFDRPVGMRDD